MRMTELFGRTLRDAPADVEGAGCHLLLRAGYVRTADSGPRGLRDRYPYLTLGKRSLDRLAASKRSPRPTLRRLRSWRSSSIYVKFTDADLIGLPLRITLGRRSLRAEGEEYKRREPGSASGDKWIVPLDSAVEAARQTLDDIEAKIIAGAKELPNGEHLR